MVEVAAIILAAGRSSRFAAREARGEETTEGASKVFAMLEGRALVGHVVAAAAASRASPLVVVTGRSAELAKSTVEGFDVTLKHNPNFALGMAGSIATGLAAVPAGADAAIILLADMPKIKPATLDALIETFDRERPDAVVPCHHGHRGNPVLIARALFPSMLRLTGDEGARRILADGSYRVAACEVRDPGVLLDVDTREALAALAKRNS